MSKSGFNLNLDIIIGINNYKNNISDLAIARQYPEAIAHLLETNYQYQVILITDRTEIQPTFERFQKFSTCKKSGDSDGSIWKPQLAPLTIKFNDLEDG